jgi:hypothetical protein
MRSRTPFLTLGLVAALLAAVPLTAQSSPSLHVLSTRADLVSGGDALVEVAGTGGSLDGVRITANGREVTSAFVTDPERRTLVGLVAGLGVGENRLEVSAGGRRAELTVVNHPLTGPILSGPHHVPIVCRTVESGLGEPLDANCSASRKVEHFYRSTTPPAAGASAAERSPFRPMPADGSRPADIATTRTMDGREVPYIVRVESGTINRSIYRIAILDDPSAPARTAGGRWAPGAGWNRRLVYSFGGGCGTNYDQGSNQATGALDDEALSRGFAFIVSTQNVMGHRCNDALSGEAMMMIKEHFVEAYGVPLWTVGRGGSGGSIQQLLIAQNYPGLLDGLLPSLTFADSFSLRVGVSDCRLLVNYFAATPSYTEAQQNAVSGHTTGTCAAWDRGLVNVIVADFARGCGIPEPLVYHPERNPGGARCTLWDTNVAAFGVDPATGFARRSLDNVGVQYGLAALETGGLSTEQFLHLNETIGGYTNDGHPRPERTVADPEAVRLAYATGRVNTAGGSLGAMPILHYRAYTDSRGDIHDRFRDFTVRERIRQANGRVDHQVIWIYSGAAGGTVPGLALETMAQWLDALRRDTSNDPQIEKVVRAKPAIAVDACWDERGTRIDEPASFDGRGRCNELYPVHRNARLVAGAPLTDDVLKCQLKPVAAADYPVRFTEAELGRLRSIFPGGVCDYSKPSAHRVPLAGSYLKLPLEGVSVTRAPGR